MTVFIIDTAILLLTAGVCVQLTWLLFFSNKIRYILAGVFVGFLGVFKSMKFVDRITGDMPNFIDVSEDVIIFVLIIMAIMYVKVANKDG